MSSALTVLHRRLAACRACPNMIGPVVHGPPIASRVFLLGQAPGPHEGKIGKPFAWTAGKTLFRWFDESLGIDEQTFRETIYMSAVARCFPGKAKGGGDRKPDAEEIARCRTFIEGEIEILQPRLVIPVGGLAISEVTGRTEKLDAVVGKKVEARFHGVAVDVIPLPHPSGASTWFKMEPGKSLLAKALSLLAKHEEIRAIVRSRRKTG